jgi:hypothetical protein
MHTEQLDDEVIQLCEARKLGFRPSLAVLAIFAGHPDEATRLLAPGTLPPAREVTNPAAAPVARPHPWRATKNTTEIYAEVNLELARRVAKDMG